MWVGVESSVGWTWTVSTSLELDTVSARLRNLSGIRRSGRVEEVEDVGRKISLEGTGGREMGGGKVTQLSMPVSTDGEDALPNPKDSLPVVDGALPEL